MTGGPGCRNEHRPGRGCCRGRGHDHVHVHVHCCPCCGDGQLVVEGRIGRTSARGDVQTGTGTGEDHRPTVTSAHQPHSQVLVLVPVPVLVLVLLRLVLPPPPPPPPWHRTAHPQRAKGRLAWARCRGRLHIPAQASHGGVVQGRSAAQPELASRHCRMLHCCSRVSAETATAEARAETTVLAWRSSSAAVVVGAAAAPHSRATPPPARRSEDANWT